MRRRGSIMVLLLPVALLVHAQSKTEKLFENAGVQVDIVEAASGADSDISPALVEDLLFYSSAKEGGEIITGKKAERFSGNFYKLYYLPVDDTLVCEGCEHLQVEGFGRQYHEGPVAWCPATGELFVTLSNATNPMKVNRLIDYQLKLVIMEKTGATWTLKEDLSFNDPGHNYAHPAISAGGDTLVFSSDRGGGYGGADLYMSVRKNGKWSRPRNLGREINTVGNEMFPTFPQNGILSFASDRYGGLGGLDIWCVDFPAPDAKAINAGKGLNSESDDFGMVMFPGKKSGFFTSKRPGTGSDDIYSFTLGPPSQKKPEQKKTTAAAAAVNFDPYLTVMVIDSETGELLPNSALALSPQEGDERHIDGNGGKFSFYPVPGMGYRLYATAPGYMWGDAVYSTPPEGLQTGEIVTIKLGLVRLVEQRTLRLENVYFALDKSDILPESATVLGRLAEILNTNPGMVIELGNHTDSRGSYEYNMRLSGRRSASVVSWLIAHGISSNQLVSKAYGETQLVNRCSDGVPCSEAEHKLNRRTEFKVLKMK